MLGKCEVIVTCNLERQMAVESKKNALFSVDFLSSTTAVHFTTAAGAAAADNFNNHLLVHV